MQSYDIQCGSSILLGYSTNNIDHTDGNSLLCIAYPDTSNVLQSNQICYDNSVQIPNDEAWNLLKNSNAQPSSLIDPKWNHIKICQILHIYPPTSCQKLYIDQNDKCVSNNEAIIDTTASLRGLPLRKHCIVSPHSSSHSHRKRVTCIAVEHVLVNQPNSGIKLAIGTVDMNTVVMKIDSSDSSTSSSSDRGDSHQTANDTSHSTSSSDARKDSTTKGNGKNGTGSGKGNPVCATSVVQELLKSIVLPHLQPQSHRTTHFDTSTSTNANASTHSKTKVH